MPTARASTRRNSRSRSGMPLRSGHGTSWLIIVPFAETTSWTYVLNVKPTRHPLPARNAQWRGAFATTLSTFIASHDGSRPDQCVHSTTETGSFKNTADRASHSTIRKNTEAYCQAGRLVKSGHEIRY